MSQFCSKCNIEQNLIEFYIRTDSKTHRKDCKTCMTKRKIELRKKNTIENEKKLKNIDKTKINKCTICKKEKPLSEFSIHKGTLSGFYSWCLICSREKDNNRKKIRKEYNENDVKKCSKCNIFKTILKYYNKKIGTSDGYSNICKECNKSYRKSISKELYQKKLYKINTNIQYKLAERIRGRLRIILNNTKVKKPKTEKLIDCTLNNFIKHLEKSFYDQITFDNYGKVWHLDHIIPCDWFDLSNINQMKACTHYTNLQPLLVNHNTVKSNKLYWVHPKSGYQITFLRLIFSNFLSLPKLIF